MPNAYRFCKYCGRELPKGKTLNFCPYCGKMLPVASVAPMQPPVEAAPTIENTPPAPDIPTPTPEPATQGSLPEGAVSRRLTEGVTPTPAAPVAPPQADAPPAPTPTPAKPTREPKPRKSSKKLGKALLAVAAVLLVLAAVYFVTPVKDIVSDALLLKQIDEAVAANDTAAALDIATRLVYPEKYTEQLVPLYYAAGMEAAEKLDCTAVLDYFALCPGYADTDEQIKRCYYQIAYGFYNQQDYDKAIEYYTKCDGYNISDEMIDRCHKMQELTELYGLEVDYVLTCSNQASGDDVYSSIRVKNDNGTLKVTVSPKRKVHFNCSYMLSGVSDGKVKKYSSGSYDFGEVYTSFTGGSASEFLDNDEQFVFGIGYINYSFNSDPERKYTLDKDQVLAIARG